MIKVVHVITDMKIGGAGRWLLNFLRNYDRSSFLIKVVVPQGSMLKDEIQKLDIETIEVQGIGDKSLDLSSIMALRSLLRRERPHILHSHASLSARIAARLSGVKSIIHTKHCIDHVRTGWKKAAAAGLNNWLGDKVIAVSEAVAKNLLEAGTPEHKICVIYSGVESLKQLSRDEIKSIKDFYGIPEEALVFGMVGRLAAVKDHRSLIEAAGHILRDRTDIRFVIAGTGPLEQQLKEMAAQKCLNQYIIFTGFLEDVESVYNILDVNMITSKSEALCLSLIEGMSLGKPMIGTAVGGVPEVVKHRETGLLVPPESPEALAAAISELADHQELRIDLGSRAKKMMMEKFSASAMAAEICRLYEDAVK